jgi:thioredoxin-dependent peroxiredoxin
MAKRKKTRKKTIKAAKRKLKSARKKVKKAAKRVVKKVAKIKRRRAIVKAVLAPTAPLVQLHEGESAPDFTVLTDDGRTVSLGDFRGKKVVLYFYPKDDTPGCTVEACAFRDGIAQIKAKGAEVLGVSVDDTSSHQKFKEKFQLNFPLLADTEKKMVQDYGVWKEKNMYGRTYMGIERTTFLIDENGTIRKIFPKVDVNAHYQEVLQALG